MNLNGGTMKNQSVFISLFMTVLIVLPSFVISMESLHPAKKTKLMSEHDKKLIQARGRLAHYLYSDEYDDTHFKTRQATALYLNTIINSSLITEKVPDETITFEPFVQAVADRYQLSKIRGGPQGYFYQAYREEDRPTRR